MKMLTLGTATALFLGVAVSANAAIISLDVAGTLGTQGLSIHDAFDGATFGGTIDVDTDARISASSGGYLYSVSTYNVDVTSGGGDVISFLGDGEEGEDASSFAALPPSDTISLNIYENIDNPATQTAERRFLSLVFLSDIDITGGQLISAAEPDFGQAFTFELGFLQFSTSQIPTTIAGATASFAGSGMGVGGTGGGTGGSMGGGTGGGTGGSMGGGNGGGTGGNPVAVPEPATSLLLITAMGGLFGLKRFKPTG